MFVIGAGICVLVLATSLAVAQQQRQGRGDAAGDRPQRGQQADRGDRAERGRGMFDPERMRQMMAERMKEQLGAGDQEWKVIEPRLMKVMDLNRQAMSGGRGFFGGRRGAPGGFGGPGGPGGRGPAQQDEQELTPVEKAAENLQTTLEASNPDPAKIKQQLTALREAREKARQQLAAAQKDLRQILTVKQEAQLVLMGMLD